MGAGVAGRDPLHAVRFVPSEMRTRGDSLKYFGIAELERGTISGESATSEEGSYRDMAGQPANTKGGYPTDGCLSDERCIYINVSRSRRK